ncbi:MAG: universal stress protein [Rhodothermales bacterium]|nr:universal stress protein [Rhodothermales bacterium]
MLQPTHPVFLVASDLRDASEGIVQAASVFAERACAELHLCHVIEPRGWLSRSVNLLEQAESVQLYGMVEASERLQKLQKQAKHCISRRTPPASIEVLTGPEATYQLVLNHAKKVGATHIVLGPHSGTAASARLLGTTAERIIRTASIPCLLLRGLVVHPPERIGAAIDLSSMSPQIVAEAARWAMRCAGPDVATLATPAFQLIYVGWSVEHIDNPGIEQTVVRPGIEQALAGAREVLGTSQNLDARTEVRWENEPVKPILQWAATNQIDLLVVGTHGRKGLIRALLGSTAMAIARDAACPVLLVPPPVETEG